MRLKRLLKATAKALTRDEIVTKAFSQAVAELAGAFGEPADTWTWGRPVLASREAVDREAEGRLVLTPAGDEK